MAKVIHRSNLLQAHAIPSFPVKHEHSNHVKTCTTVKEPGACYAHCSSAIVLQSPWIVSM